MNIKTLLATTATATIAATTILTGATTAQAATTPTTKTDAATTAKIKLCKQLSTENAKQIKLLNSYLPPTIKADREANQIRNEIQKLTNDKTRYKTNSKEYKNITTLIKKKTTRYNQLNKTIISYDKKSEIASKKAATLVVQYAKNQCHHIK